MSKVYLADFKNKQIVGKMEQPDATKILGGSPFGSDYEVLDESREIYNNRTKYPASWITEQMDGKEMVEGVDFEIEEQFWEGTSWWPVKHLVDGKVKPGTNVRTVAIHPTPKETGEGKEAYPQRDFSDHPSGQYQRLFNWLKGKDFIALQSEMQEVIDIVHEDFPAPSLVSEDVEQRGNYVEKILHGMFPAHAPNKSYSDVIRALRSAMIFANNLPHGTALTGQLVDIACLIWDYENERLKASRSTPEEVEFAEWVSNNQFTCYNNIWTSTKIHYMPTEYSTQQLYQLFKSKNK